MHLHKYSKWGLPVSIASQTNNFGSSLVQWRRCEVCGVVKSRKVKAAGVSADQIVKCLEGLSDE